MNLGKFRRDTKIPSLLLRQSQNKKIARQSITAPINDRKAGYPTQQLLSFSLCLPFIKNPITHGPNVYTIYRVYIYTYIGIGMLDCAASTRDTLPHRPEI